MQSRLGRTAQPGRPVEVVATRQNSNLLILIPSAALSLVIAVAGSHFIPMRYYIDGQVIQYLAQGRPFTQPDSSFEHTASVYSSLGLADQPVLVGVLAYLGLWSAIFVAAPLARLQSAATRTTVFLAVGAVIASVYICQYSKEVLVLPIVVLVARLGRSWKAELLVVAVLLLYAEYVRTYWFLVAILYIVLLSLFTLASKKLTVAGAFMGLVCLVVGFNVILGSTSNYYRELANTSRLGLDVNTRIMPFVNVTGLVSDGVNTLATLLTLVIPVPLLQVGSFLYVSVALLLSTGWVVLLRRMTSLLSIRASSRSHHEARAAAFMLAFLLVQSLFEPDYGSYIKHLSPLLPLALVLVSAKYEHARKVRT